MNTEKTAAMAARVRDLLPLLQQLKVQTGSLACLGCGHEHNCSLHGCAIIREAVEAIEELRKENDHETY